MTDGITPRDLSLRLADEIEAVVRDLGLGGGRRGRQLCCVPPWGDTKKPKLEIELTPIAGKWNDWNSGVSGDALGLVGCVLTGQPDMRTREARREGIKWAKARYGLDGGDFDQAAWARNVEAAKGRAEASRKAAVAELKRARGVAQHVWINCEPLRPTTRTGTVILPGCVGARYLEARGIDFAVLGRLPRAIHVSTAERWVRSEGDQVVQEHIGPALVSAMTLDDGTFASVHRIWINPDQEGEKADLDPPRKMWPASEGAAIRLWRGANQLTVNDAVAKGLRMPQVVCEGLETGLSIAMMTPEYRVDAAGSLPGILSYTPPKCASELIIAGENDWGPQARTMLHRCVERFAAMKMPPRVAFSPVGSDFNDLLQADE